VVKELLHRRPETALPPGTAETSSKFRKITKMHRNVQGAAKRTADECGRGMWENIDGLIHRRNFSDRDALV